MEVLNRQVELEVKANSMYTSMIPKPGVLFIGDRGLEFRGEGQGYIQIPYKEIVGVRAQLFFGRRYVRGFFVDTKTGSFNFVVSKGRVALQTMGKHLPHNIFSRNVSSFESIFKRITKR
ncbi:DUF956 family protein [Periweissella ghanensis]|uniref:Uncharacterized protein n=1 Tax=Periweissella ghanensis TaxID=467997 RepID=A0ABM8ZF07_9LACO|nr:DUF956 family protein [Periweissella ghanensis]MCM0600384.1 DUF956 family protein [Periweissella ghanensis]CAH0419304.1 hypothetical protein WGH24286_01752 [Periweissella ghanensis]